MINIAIFASGAGTNALNIIQHFAHSPIAKVVCIVVNKPNAGVITKANAEGVPIVLIDKLLFDNENALLQQLNNYNVNFIVLAGFLWKVPEYLTNKFVDKIINIHPALLPNYGGRGMYGMHVHNAVIANNEKQSGITIHYVNAHYDEGQIIAQYTTNITPQDTPETLAHKIHVLEHMHFAPTIANIISTIKIT